MENKDIILYDIDETGAYHTDPHWDEKIKQLYSVKGWNGIEWKHFQHIYLNPHDTPEEKEQTINGLKKEYGQQYEFNISNSFSVYC